MTAPDTAVTILGAILAGGQARRFGSDKALAHLAGLPLIEHVARALAPQVDAIAVIGRDHAGFESVADRPAGGLGPLAAINAALHFAQAHGHAAVLSVPCDTPVLPGELRVMLDHGEAAAFVADLPVIGWWPVVLAAGLDDWLAAGESRSVRAWARAIGATAVPMAAIANVNTPGDLAGLANATRVDNVSRTDL